MNRSLGDERTVKWVDNSRLCARCMDPHSGAGEFETMEETVSGECRKRQLEKRVEGGGGLDLAGYWSGRWSDGRGPSPLWLFYKQKFIERHAKTKRLIKKK